VCLCVCTTAVLVCCGCVLCVLALGRAAAAVSATAATEALVLPLPKASCSQSAQRLCNSVDSTHTHLMCICALQCSVSTVGHMVYTSYVDVCSEENSATTAIQSLMRDKFV
jgi:hypothetical protein